MPDLLIRRNTKDFKGLNNLFLMLHGEKDRPKNISLFIVPPGQDIMERVHISALKASEKGFYYDLTWENILGNFRDKQQKLYRSEDIPHLYFFRDSSNPAWDKTPFQVKASLEKELPLYAEMDVPEPPEQEVEEIPEESMAAAFAPQKEETEAEPGEAEEINQPAELKAKGVKKSSGRRSPNKRSSAKNKAAVKPKEKAPEEKPVKLKKGSSLRITILDKKGVEMLEYLLDRKMIERS